jgi:hypothetical protein
MAQMLAEEHLFARWQMEMRTVSASGASDVQTAAGLESAFVPAG